MKTFYEYCYYTILNNVERIVGYVYADACLFRGQIKRVLE